MGLVFASVIVGRWPGWRWSSIRQWLLLRLAHQHARSNGYIRPEDYRRDYGALNVKPDTHGMVAVTVRLILTNPPDGEPSA